MIGDSQRVSVTTRSDETLSLPIISSGTNTGASSIISAETAPSTTAVVHSTIPATRHASSLLAPLAQPHKDRHEGSADGVVCDHGADQIRQVECDRERRVDGTGADQGGGDDLTHQSRDAGDGRRGSEGSRGRGQTAGICHKRESLVVPTAGGEPSLSGRPRRRRPPAVQSAGS